MQDCQCQLLLGDSICSCQQAWQQAGERLAVFINANENTLTGVFHGMFVGPNSRCARLWYIVIQTQAGNTRQCIAMYCKGDDCKGDDALGECPINGVFATPNLPFDAALGSSLCHTSVTVALQFLISIQRHWCGTARSRSFGLWHIDFHVAFLWRWHCTMIAWPFTCTAIRFFLLDHITCTTMRHGMEISPQSNAINWRHMIGSGLRACFLRKRNAACWLRAMSTFPRRWILQRNAVGFGNKL